MNNKKVIVVMLFALAAILGGAGSGFAATYYWDGGGDATNINDLANWSANPAGAGADAVPAFVEGDVLVFKGLVGGALVLSTSAGIGVGVTLTLDAAQAAAVSITPGHAIKLSGIDMSAAATTLNIGAGAGTVALSAPANFITKAGQTLTFAEALDNGGFLLTVSGDGTPNFSGGMTGAGGITLNMSTNEAVTFSGVAASYTGDTTITKGILTTGAATLLTDSGTYLLANSVNAGISTGGIETIGSLSGGGVAGGNVVMGGALTINQAVSATYSGIISGAHAVQKLGVGTLKLAGINTYSGATDVNAGTLLINAVQAGSCTGAVTVSNANTTLGGTGTIKGAVTINTGALVKPGDGAVGTLTTTDVFTFANGSKLIVDVLNATCDLLAVGTVLTVGATSEIELGTVPGSLAMQYTVVTSASGGSAFQTTGLTAGWSQVAAATSIKLNGVLSASAVSVPTLTEWGFILFALLISAFAIRRMRKKSYSAV